MARESVRRADSSTPVNSIDGVQTYTLRHGEAGQPSSVRLSTVVKGALQAHYGSLQAAACSMTPVMDEGQLSRELKSGDFKLEKLERLDTEGQAAVAHAIHDAYGERDPKAHRMRLINTARRSLDALAEEIA